MKIEPTTSKPMDIVTVGLCALTVVCAGSTAATDMPFWPQQLGNAPSVGVVVLAAGLAVSLIIHTYFWWRDLDEAAQEAHKWAWWWGGNIGFFVGAAGFLGATLFGIDLLPAAIPHTDAALIAAGFIAAFAAQAAGYTLAWCGWWMARQ